jgi:hypothetical protein
MHLQSEEMHRKYEGKKKLAKVEANPDDARGILPKPLLRVE